MKRLVLIDFSTVAYQIAAIAENMEDPVSALSELIRVYESNGGLYKRKNEKIAVLWCVDAKENGRYWRHIELEKIGISYKPDRPLNESVDLVKEVMHKSISDSRKCSYPGFEADDVIANLCNQFAHLEKDIITCDTDLMQLVDERTRWLNTMSFNSKKDLPQIRDLQSSITYIDSKWGLAKLKTKYGLEVNHPSQIVDIKVALGDDSDGLPRGISRDIIDLRNPRIKCPFEYRKPLIFKEANPRTRLRYYAKHTPILNDNLR